MGARHHQHPASSNVISSLKATQQRPRLSLAAHSLVEYNSPFLALKEVSPSSANYYCMNPGRALSQLLQARTRTSSSSLSAALTNYNLSSTGPASLALITSSQLRLIYTSSTPSPLARSRPTMTIFKHSHDPTSTETAESSNVSSRRESVVSTDSSATVHPGGTEGNVNGNDGVPPGEVIQAEIAAARAIPSSLLTSLGAWWNSSEQTARDSETRLLKRIPFFRTPHEPDVQPTPENPNPITARVTQVPLKDNARSSKGGRMINMCSFLTPETKGGKEAVVLTHGYGAGLAFFYRNLQEMAETSGESSVVFSRLSSGESASLNRVSCLISDLGNVILASVGRAAYAIDWLGMGRSSRPDPKELVSGRGTSAKERVEKVSLEILHFLGLIKVLDPGSTMNARADENAVLRF